MNAQQEAGPRFVRVFCVDHRVEGENNPFGTNTIGVGACRRPGVLYDDDGENISSLNPCLNEATAMWWAWRHPEIRHADYLGFCHYRRFLWFHPVRDRDGQPDKLRAIRQNPSRIGRFAASALQVSAAAARLRNSGTDGFLPVHWECPLPSLLAWGEAEHAFSKRWAEALLELVQEREPAFADFFRTALISGRRLYICNLFVVRTALFERLCDTLFPAVLRLAEAWQMEPATWMSAREPGFLTEYLVGSWWRWLEETGQARFEHCQPILLHEGGKYGWKYLLKAHLAYRFYPTWLNRRLYREKQKTNSP